MSPESSQWDEEAVWGENADQWKREPEYMQADLAEDIGDQINALMAKKGMTQAQLAERIGSSDAYISQLLGGGSNFTLKTLIKLARALEAHVHVNFDREVELSEAAAERYRRWDAQDRAGHADDHASPASAVIDHVDWLSNDWLSNQIAGPSPRGVGRVIQRYDASDLGIVEGSQVKDLPLVASYTALVSTGTVTMEAVGEGS